MGLDSQESKVCVVFIKVLIHKPTNMLIVKAQKRKNKAITLTIVTRNIKERDLTVSYSL